MSLRSLIIWAAVVALLLGCVGPRYAAPAVPQGDYVRLYATGSWGFDSDTWIYPDDHFTVTSFATTGRRVEERRYGVAPGLFRAIVKRAEGRSAWKITTVSLQQDFDLAQRTADAAHGVMDLDTYRLEIRYGGRRMEAEFYAPKEYSEVFPKVRSLRVFAELTEAVREGTGRGSDSRSRRTGPTNHSNRNK